MELPLPRDNQFLFLDMNAFFASCEQHRRPELRGRPVGVTPTPKPSGCVIAASYEAKKLGVSTGCRVGEAQKRIPGIVIVPADPKFYVQIHNQIHNFLLTEITPNPIKLSIDEFAIPLDKREQWTPNAHALAIHIKKRLSEIFSPWLRCSIGIGPNLFLAKLGTEIQKPNGLVIIQLHNLEQAYEPLQLRDIPGINWGMSNRLHGLGIRTPGQFLAAPQPLLHAAFGISGDAWWHNLRGYRVDVATSPTKSISHSHVLEPNLRTKTEARAVFYKLFLKVMDRLREKQLSTSAVAVYIRSHDAWWQHKVAVRPTQSSFQVFRAMARAYDDTLPPYFQPKRIVVWAWELQPYQPSWLGLFPEDSPKEAQLFAAVDSLNEQFGRWTVQPASLLKIRESAPNRIAFRVPDFAMD